MTAISLLFCSQQISGGKSYFHLGLLDSDGSNSQGEPTFPSIISSSKVSVQYIGNNVLNNSLKIWLLVFFCFHTTVSTTDCDFFLSSLEPTLIFHNRLLSYCFSLSFEESITSN